MMGWIGFLLEDRARFEPQVQKALEAVQRNARLQRRLIEDMVDVARIHSGKLRLERELVDLGEIAEATGMAMAVAARERKIDIELQCCEGGFVLGDAQRLEQMLQNLIGNAIKFTPEGGRVSVRVERRPAVTRLSVGDTGRGIDPTLQTLIFQPFRQGIPEHGQRDAGLGLGLAITKAIVELHGGHISVSSAGADRGSEFCVELPAAQAPQDASSDRALPAIEGTLTGVRILLVDDEEDVRENTARVLARAGAEVVGVGGTESALARLEDQPFDIIVSDLMMPGTDGWELARRVRARYVDLPIVALSGVAGSLASGRAEASGFAALLKKPIEEHELVTRVRAFLRR
jgi:CheY-like chemotaxis protein/two-component sensor histidine kinase